MRPTKPAGQEHPVEGRRREVGMSQKELGGLAEISEAFVSLIEGYLREPSIEIKVRIARCLGRRVDELFPPVRGREGGKVNRRVS
jgi:DNA-binding XRE family transcriptional regulator